MKPSLQVGDKTQFSFRIPATKTVPHLYPEAREFQLMPTVFATGFMVGLMEWTCLHILAPHLEENEGSLGVHINVSHIAATVPGQTATVDAECTAIDGRRVSFRVRAHDGIDLIGEGEHQRVIVDWTKFEQRVNDKARRARLSPISRNAG
ncbi:thioesterase [Hyphomicrobium methylovorum]|uniref:thioesterase family protein n=1 Tax=Hyphomicrobium methylovorum TaxID=84 RepID=UPI0015E63926|nr:thioesterase family protein [Hyphomicrobium methylovorum]MBA2125151.1 thioesterase [Hyphomicrobium methylovorum]